LVRADFEMYNNSLVCFNFLTADESGVLLGANVVVVLDVPVAVAATAAVAVAVAGR